MPQAGLLLQTDGSRHDWLGERGPRLTLVAAIDDATGLVTAATFRDHEDAAGYLSVLSAAEAATYLGLSLRSVRRLLARYRAAEGAAALVHGNRGRTPANRLADDTRARLVELATST